MHAFHIHVYIKHNVKYRILWKDALSFVFVTCNFRFLTSEFYVLSFRFCLLCYITAFDICILLLKGCDKGHKKLR